ncbi:hypothetical protein [Rhodopila sp.]|uniref:hypothetical protein n=1 Tax=Rhodopila sp. TaxID=2480087 RepID=UPI003D14B5B2
MAVDAVVGNVEQASGIVTKIAKLALPKLVPGRIHRMCRAAHSQYWSGPNGYLGGARFCQQFSLGIEAPAVGQRGQFGTG